eukprot:Tbor_TRINITY_DN5912_c0_g4::TRINITY_DN5912_c0_g4_i2::g.18717::m.18717
MMSVGPSRGFPISKHVLIAATALIIILVCIAYKAGVSTSSSESKLLGATTQLKESSIQSDITACEEKLAKSRKGISSPALKPLYDEVSQLVIKNKNAFSRLEQYRQKLGVCEKKLEIQERSSDENSEDVKNLNEEKKILEELRKTLESLTDGRGARMTISFGALRNMRTSYMNINKYIGREILQDPEHIKQLEAELLAKWSAKIELTGMEEKTSQLYATKNITDKWQFFNVSEVLEQQDVSRVNSTTSPPKPMVVLSQNISIHLPQQPPKPLFIKKSQAANSSIFFVGAESLDGKPIRPSWNNNVMQIPIKSFKEAGRASMTIIPQTSVAAVMISLYDAVMCGAIKDTIVTIPSVFYWTHPTRNQSSVLTELYDVIDSPLLTLCDGCKYILETRIFQMACGLQPATMNYGSREFWVARSRLRFSPKVYELAETFLEEHNIDGDAPFISVVYHTSNSVDADCTKGSVNGTLPYLRHRLWISQNFGTKAVNHITPNDYDSQCAPSIADVKKGIQVMIEAMKLEDLISTVYVSLPVEYTDILEQSKLKGIKIITRNINVAQDEAVDAVIASRARSILVSPFFKHSQIVTEMYLLYSRFNPSGIYFF